MAATDTAPRDPRYRSIDFWRGVACLLVILYHSALVYDTRPPVTSWSGADALLRFFGWFHIGVPLFFVISGYCIAATADGSRLRADSVVAYFKRRMRRIYPPLWAVIALTFLFFLVVDTKLSPGLLTSSPWEQPRPWWYSGWQWFGNLTLTETWRHYVIGGPRGHFPGQAWTLCYEEQFYAVVGILILMPRYFFLGALVLTVFDAALVGVLSVAGWNIDGVFLDGYWLTFAAGILVYYVLNYGERRSRWPALAALVVGCAVGTLGALPGGGSGFGFAGILILAKPLDRALVASRWAAPILVCGRMCYSLYLVHQILVKAVTTELIRMGVTSAWQVLLMNIPACVAVSVAAGWVFHRLVERRFLNTPRLPAPALTVPRALVAAAE
jgi:peptidoglycan/LPS O-acetylase OafA/YrhL